MIYITQNEEGWQLDDYFAYLATVRTAMPLKAYSFASDPQNYDPSSHQSLHDAWLESLVIREPSSGGRHEVRQIEIECLFLGPYHDREILLRYLNVMSYHLRSPALFSGPPALNTGHGDLLMHEMRLESSMIVHEMRFSRGSELLITANGFEHEVREVPTRH